MNRRTVWNCLLNKSGLGSCVECERASIEALEAADAGVVSKASYRTPLLFG